MKLIPLALILMSANVFAEVPEITATHVSCQELKEELEKYGSLVVVKKFLFFKRKKLINHQVECASDGTKVSYVYRTADESRCSLGEYCQYPSYDYDSGSYSDSGSSDWGHDSGWGSSGSSSGSDYSPPSSDYRGPSYNPPSSDTRGSNYNPPSSGTRGSRYCPSC